MFDLYGCYFMYGDFNSEDYDLVFGNMDTSRLMALEASKNINTVRSRKHNVHYVNRVSYVDEPISFEAEIFTRDTTPIMLEDLPVIEHALFNRQSYTKLYQIMSHERDPVYINCILTNPEKIENLSGIVGYKFVVNMDSVMAWEEASTQETSVESSTTTLTGDMVSFTEDKEYPMKQMSIELDAVQDLHGQSDPYPAGSGKNKLPLIDGNYVIGTTGGSTGVTITISNGKVTLTGTAVTSGGRTTRLSEYFTLQAGTYIISPVQNGSPYIRGYINKKSDDTAIGYSNGTGIVISEETEVYYGINVESDVAYNATCYPQIEAGSTITDYAPYENICPIIGQYGVNVMKTGANIFGGDLLRDGVIASMPSATNDAENRTVRFSAAANTNQNITRESGLTGKFKENTRYTFIITLSKNSGTGSNLRVYYADNTYSIIPPVSAANTKETVVLVTSANKTVYSLQKSNSSGYTTVYYDESGIFEGVLTAEDFTSYTGQTYTTAINIWDEEWVNGYFSATGAWNTSTDTIASKNPISVQPNTTYYFNVGSNQNCYVTYWTEAVPSGTTDNTHIISRSSALQNATFTTPANCYAIHFNAGTAYGGTYKNDISINTPSSVKAYLPYKGQATTENYINAFGNGLYGGTLNVITGMLTVTHFFYEVQGTEGFTEGDSAYLKISDTFPYCKDGQSGICSHFKYSRYDYVFAGVNASSGKYLAFGKNYINSSLNISSVAEFNTWLATQKANSTPVCVCYELATPIEIQLTAADMKTLIGQNNIWTDVGEVTVSYSQTNDFHVDVDTDLNDYIYPDVTIEVGSEGGDIIIYNATDDATRFTEFSSVPPSTTFTMKGSINHITNNMYPYFTSRNFIRLVNGRNNFFMYGDISKITFSFNNRKYM